MNYPSNMVLKNNYHYFSTTKEGHKGIAQNILEDHKDVCIFFCMH